MDGERNAIYLNLPIGYEQISFKLRAVEQLSSGRSLNVFISWLRKYLKEDSRISMVNVHHIGYQIPML
ncbi:hypothetical protein PQ465_15540 [Sphingobacterium oryzagri]|uniref:OmpR/PhoB-type domain-containing protein n=1 Tax=Sphingobacterium oryzagri TaxID=3025669 RepID=A0ABY7WDI4_9SPHI|nr:hypothetical protein [Sphingobacterium sp. KACC 22765]WDF67714.1 hypothetical protein PQ465_15540 [Sphingobacterium sp. KACC 22765]